METKGFKVFPWKVVRDSQKRTLRGNEFQRVGADAQKEREPNRRLVRGTGRSFDVEERKALVGAYAHNCWAR